MVDVSGLAEAETALQRFSKPAGWNEDPRAICDARLPAACLIPSDTFASQEDVGRFRDVAPEAGLNVFATAGGLIVDDLAGEGHFDVVSSNFDSCGPMAASEAAHRAADRAPAEIRERREGDSWLPCTS